MFHSLIVHTKEASTKLLLRCALALKVSLAFLNCACTVMLMVFEQCDHLIEVRSTADPEAHFIILPHQFNPMPASSSQPQRMFPR